MGSIEDLLGKVLVDNKKNTVDVASVLAQNEVIGLYFSAHWCPPCRGFTPSLSKFYENMKKAGKKFEIVFVSSDRDENDWQNYFNDMPWLALPFSDREKKNLLSSAFGVSGIPTLILLDAETGDIITDSARMNVMQDPSGSNFPWRE